MFLSRGIQIKTGKPFETPSLLKNALLTFVNRLSSPKKLKSQGSQRIQIGERCMTETVRIKLC